MEKKPYAVISVGRGRNKRTGGFGFRNSFQRSDSLIPSPANNNPTPLPNPLQSLPLRWLDLVTCSSSPWERSFSDGPPDDTSERDTGRHVTQINSRTSDVDNLCLVFENNSLFS